MARALVVLVLSTLALPCAAQPPACDSLPGPTLSAMPDEPPALHGPAEATLARAAAIEAMAASDPARPAAMFELAEAQRTLGRTSDEVRTLATIVQDHPSAPDAARVQYRLARALVRQGQHDAARIVWMHVLRSFPTSPYVQAAYVELGDYYASMGNLELSRSFYERALTTPPASWTAYAHYRLAWALAHAGDRTALDHVRDALAALTASPQLSEASVRSALASDQGALARALACHP